jgi:hypothetical protein
MVGSQLLQHLPAYIADVFPGAFGESPDKILYEQWNIFRSLAQQRTTRRQFGGCCSEL